MEPGSGRAGLGRPFWEVIPPRLPAGAASPVTGPKAARRLPPESVLVGPGPPTPPFSLSPL